jgi:hypothetical protein
MGRGRKIMRQQTIAAWSLALCAIIVPSLAAPGALTSQASAPASIWWVPLGSALIGAISAIITLLLKDVIIQQWSEKRAKLDSQRAIFRNYAAPLIASSEKLIWRFSEIFIDNRHQFLRSVTMPLVYNDYKRKSTLYRIASLLGWIRAIHLELSALPRGATGFKPPTSEAIGKIQSALADGPHVEVQRLEQLCTVWRLDISSLDDERKKKIATRAEVKLYELAGDKLERDSEHLRNMAGEQKTKLCQSMANFLCQELQRSTLGAGIIKETINQAIAAMSYREALIYRDWQDAIGDAMLEKDIDSVRRFRIVGYEKFEDILRENSHWMEVFRESIDDIDFESIDPNDFRAKQLKDLSVAVSGILISLSESEEKDLVNSSALEVAHKLVALM